MATHHLDARFKVLPFWIAELATVIEYKYSRDGTARSSDPIEDGMICPYKNGACTKDCVAIRKYPEMSPFWDVDIEKRPNFGYCIRLLKDLLEVEKLKIEIL